MNSASGWRGSWPVLGRLAPRTLRSKLVLLTCLVTLFSTVVIGAAGYVKLKQVILQSAVESLAGKTRLVALKFTEPYGIMERDVRLFAHTSPVIGMTRSLANGGIDPESGLSTEQWRARMETVCSTLLNLHSYYTQARFIGIADGGRELVRVNRSDGALKAVAPADYQQKGSESYFVATLGLPRDQIYFSEVTYNRERGQIALPKVATIRAAIAVYDDDGKPFGIVVINANYEEMLRQTFEQIPSDVDTTVMNSHGDYMHRSPGQPPNPLEFHEGYTRIAPPFERYFEASAKAEQVFETQDALSYFARLNIDPSSTAADLGAVLTVPLSELYAPAYASLRRTVAIGIALVALTVLATFTLGQLLTRRLRQMTETVAGADPESGMLDLLDRHDDELGELSRAFNRLLQEREKLVEKLVRSNRELEEFAHVAAHDLKAPLRVIDNASKWIEEDLGDDLNEETVENLGLLRGRARRMERLLDDLLDYARINRLEDARYHQPISGENLMAEVLDLLEIPPDFRITVSKSFNAAEFHRMPLQQIMTNLIGNAIKHHQSEAGLVEIGLTELEDYYSISVRDDGPGIEAAYHETVFRMFQTLRPRDQVEGSGMGLAVVKKHIELFGGRIEVQSDPRRGATFVFTWPKRQQRL